MALARCCNICGTFYHPYNLDKDSELDRDNFTCIGFYNLDERCGPCTGRHEGREYYDLCPHCHDELIHFLSKLTEKATMSGTRF